MTIRKISNVSLGSINTTKLLTIGTVEVVYVIGSGNRAFEATNLGSYKVYYGNSAVRLNSGGLLDLSASKFWDNVTGDFDMRFITYSGSSLLVIHEYAGF